MKKVSTMCVMNIIMLVSIIIASIYLINDINKLKLLENYEEQQLENADLENIEDNVVNSKCAPCDVDRNKLRWEQINGDEKVNDVAVMFGTPTKMGQEKNISYKNNQENAPSTGIGDKKVCFYLKIINVV